MIKKIFLLFLLSGYFVIIGCATDFEGSSIEEKNYSLIEIRGAITHVAGEPREISQNYREYKSQYFSRRADSKFNFETAPERLHAHFYILGERRPFEIRILVIVEKRSKEGYIKSSEDKLWSEKIKKEIIEKLNQSRENRNMIDDFKSF